MIKHNLVIFDIDDTLGHFTKMFDDYMSEVLNCPKPDRNVSSSYSLMQPFVGYDDRFGSADVALKSLEITGRIKDPKFFEPTRALSYALRHQQLGHQILALTARSWMNNPVRDTETWLESVGLNIDVYSIGLHDSKADWINSQCNEESIMVYEDNPRHITEIKEKCTSVSKIVVVNHPHNRDLVGFDRIY